MVSALCAIITDKHEIGTDKNKNDPVFHFTLLRDTLEQRPRGVKKTPLSFAPELADQTPSPPFSVSLRSSISAASFHDGEWWLKWLYWRSLMGPAVKPESAWEMWRFCLESSTPFSAPC